LRLNVNQKPQNRHDISRATGAKMIPTLTNNRKTDEEVIDELVRLRQAKAQMMQFGLRSSVHDINTRITALEWSLGL